MLKESTCNSYFVVVQSLSHYLTLCNPIDCSTPVLPSLSFPVSWSLFKLMSIEVMMPSNHLILCHLLLLLPSIFPASGTFPMSRLSTSGGQSTGASASASALPMNQFGSVAQSCLNLCNPMDYSTPGFTVHHQLLELAHSCPLSQ